MIGGLQGENGDLDIKNLKQNIQKCRSQISGNFRRNSVALCKKAKSFRSKRVISQPCKILPSAWSDRLPMAVTPSFQLQIAQHLKNWIVDFLSFETTYSMHKLDFIKCSKSVWYYYHQEYASWQISLCFLSLHSGFAYGKGLQSFSSSCFWAFHCFAMDSK